MRSDFSVALITLLKIHMVFGFQHRHLDRHTLVPLMNSRSDQSSRRDFMTVATGLVFSTPVISRAEGLPYYKKQDDYAVGQSFQADRATRVRRLTKRTFILSAKSLPSLQTMLDDSKGTALPSVQGASRIRLALREFPFASLRKDGKEILTLLALEDEAFPDAAGWSKPAATALEETLSALGKLDYACLRIEQRLDTANSGAVDACISALKAPLTEFAQRANAFADSALTEDPNPPTESASISPFSSYGSSNSGGWAAALENR